MGCGCLHSYDMMWCDLLGEWVYECLAVIETTIIPVLPAHLCSQGSGCGDNSVTPRAKCVYLYHVSVCLFIYIYLFFLFMLMIWAWCGPFSLDEHNFRSSYLAGLSASLPITDIRNFDPTNINHNESMNFWRMYYNEVIWYILWLWYMLAPQSVMIDDDSSWAINFIPCKLMVEGTDCPASLGQGPSCSLNSWALAIYLEAQHSSILASMHAGLDLFRPERLVMCVEWWRNYQMPILWDSMRKSDIPYSPDGNGECVWSSRWRVESSRV